MNFPVGNVLSRAPLPANIKELLTELENNLFNGYLVMSVKGDCIEEGVLFFKEGEPIAAIAECLFFEKTFKGKEALKYVMNQTKGDGFFQTIELSKNQIDLVTAFDGKILLGDKINLKDLSKLIPDKFQQYFEISECDDEAVDRYGLSCLKK